VALLDRRFEHGVRTGVGVRDRDAAETLAGADVGITLVIVFLIDGVEERVVPGVRVAVWPAVYRNAFYVLNR